MLNGYYDRILRINLTTGEVQVESRGEYFWRRFVGGRNFIAFTLLTELPKGTDPLSPDNKLVFATGPLSGFPIAGAARHSIGAKSPLTCAYGDGEAGGFWSTMFRRAGYDALIVEGKAKNPVYLFISKDRVQIRNADHLWGHSVLEVENIIRDDCGNDGIRILQCGIAGENQVRFASVMSDLNRAVGRTGMGAVMGSKNLKAVAVLGDRLPPAANREQLQEIQQWLLNNYQQRSKWAVEMGTPGMIEILQELGGLPTRNFQAGRFEGADQIAGKRLHAELLVGRDTCYGCPIKCKQIVEVTQGPYQVNPKYGGPEYETLCSFGSNCGVANLEAIAKANELCASAGLDTISTGSVVAFAMECFERGLLTLSDTDGLNLRFGNSSAMVMLVEKIYRREGIGNLLAEGVARASRQIGQGAEAFAMHVKNQELPMHEPRLKQGMGLGYAVSPTGADHEHNIHDTDYTRAAAMERINKQLGLNLPAMQLDDLGHNKVVLLRHEVNWRHFLNCLIMCYFMPYGYERTRDIANAVLGWDLNVGDCLTIGERSANMTRLFNSREGIDASADKLPKRMFDDLIGGPPTGSKIDAGKMNRALSDYYQVMGWDVESGTPTVSKLIQLDLGDFTSLGSSGKLQK